MPHTHDPMRTLIMLNAGIEMRGKKKHDRLGRIRTRLLNVSDVLLVCGAFSWIIGGITAERCGLAALCPNAVPEITQEVLRWGF